ncbi:alpha/beta fold hydrolase [Saccharococcus thermophilus]|uniref:Pimeloyl-ACP methyl ester carboxylesterase n=1 Tax=Saccharococcus thermophilus TaxID=29396 RepID=A0A846MAS5_9BACL|nr:alpha/beta hydrolase [Saccharococcus thermophilus]NIK14111.1 pimeloyl-ACP methyl ester carboxylesterase [Saccharococcus thermophilus]
MHTIETNGQTIELNHIRVYYETYNWEKKRPVLVLLHGFLSSSFSYRRLIPLLANDFSVITVDLPPFGNSEKSTTFRYTYRNLAQLVIDLLQHLHIPTCTLVGHSMGGQICLYIARMQPQLVREMILLASSGYLGRVKRSLTLSTYLPYFHAYVKHYFYKQGVEANLRQAIYDYSLIDNEMCKGYEQPFYHPQMFKALTRFIRYREGDLQAHELQRIETRTLLLWGENDRIVPVDIGKRLHEDLTNSALVTFPHTGHLLPEERPHDVYREITDFIR